MFIRFFFFTLVILSIKSSLFSLLDEHNDKQFWSFQSLSLPIVKEKTEFLIEGEERWGDDMTKLFYYHMQYCLKFKVCDALSIAPGFRRIWAKISDFQASTNANILLLDVFLTKKDENFTLTNRNRIEYAFAQNNNNFWLYRFRLELMYTKPCLQPYISDEFFFLNNKGIRQNRLILGFKVPISKKSFVKLEYMERIVSLQDKWRRHPVFGVLFFVKL